MLNKREVIEQRRRNKIDVINGDSVHDDSLYHHKKSSFKGKIDHLNMTGRFNILLNHSIVLTPKQLGLKYNKKYKIFYADKFEDFNKNILLYNLGSSKIKLILHYDPINNIYELLSSISRDGIEVTYINYPVRTTYKIKIEKYNLKFDIHKNMWFSQDINKYLDLKNKNNDKLNLYKY